MPNQSLTITEFCKLERISRSKLYQLWSAGRGPAYYCIGNGTHRRITGEARREWHRQLEAEAATTTPSMPMSSSGRK